MKNTKHTPGEWKLTDNFKIEEDQYEPKFIIEIPGTSGAKLSFPDKEYFEDQAEFSEIKETVEANARLIAAAPTLLEACQAMLDAPGSGEPNGNTPQARAQRQSVYDKIYAAIQKATISK